jgi:hypothetical protein
MKKIFTPQKNDKYPAKDYTNKQKTLNDLYGNLLENEYKERRLYEYKVAY